MKLSEYRANHNWTQEQAAETYTRYINRHVPQGQWSKWETGESMPSAHHAWGLDKFTNGSVTYLDHKAAYDAARKVA